VQEAEPDQTPRTPRAPSQERRQIGVMTGRWETQPDEAAAPARAASGPVCPAGVRQRSGISTASPASCTQAGRP